MISLRHHYVPRGGYGAITDVDAITITDYNNDSFTAVCWSDFTGKATAWINYYESFGCRVNQRERSLFFNHKINILTLDTPQNAIKKMEKAKEDKKYPPQIAGAFGSEK
jgi:hypothetical protein